VKILYIVTVVGLLLSIAAASAPAQDEATADRSFHYDDYGAVLNEFVDDGGLVDYAALKDGRERLNAYTGALAKLDRTAYEVWNEKEKIAFWINAYNGLTLILIIDHYPIKSSRLRSVVFPKNSIMQIPGRWKKITFEVMGEPITLDAIEHKVLRARFDEPRIHVALVCAALSCPELRNEPFVAERLDEQLDDQAQKFLANDRKFVIDREAGVVRLSAIFDWFAEDFVGHYGTGDPAGRRSEKTQAVINFVSEYVSDADGEYLASGDYRIKYLDYDWTLNERPDA
jgi:hypothetical protein